MTGDTQTGSDALAAIGRRIAGRFRRREVRAMLEISSPRKRSRASGALRAVRGTRYAECASVRWREGKTKTPETQAGR